MWNATSLLPLPLISPGEFFLLSTTESLPVLTIVLKQFLQYGLLLLLTVSLVAGSDAGNMSKHFSWQFRLAAALRTPILVFVVVPISFLLNTYRHYRTLYRAYVHGQQSAVTLRADHERRVQTVVQQLQQWNRDGRKRKLRTARPNWAQMSLTLGSNKGDAHCIKTGHLNHILEVNEEDMTVTCEPAVNMGDITATLLPKQLALLCQVEMESLTIGGLSMGLGMETNSHVVGWFQETVVAFEIVTAEKTPRILKVTRENNPDLFYALPHSLGTLGFLVSVTVKMTKTKPFVKMHYIFTKSAQELQDTMTKLSEGRDPHTGKPVAVPQFLEATCFTKDTAVVQCGLMVEAPTKSSSKIPINPINRWYKPFYYKHLQALLERSCQTHGNQTTTYEEILPLQHYYHRFTRSIFWEIEYMIPFSSHFLYRFFWGWMGAPEVSLLKLFQGPVIRKQSVYAHVIQESCMPVRRLKEGLDKFEEWWDIYPLLVFPIRTYDRGLHSGFLNPRGNNLCPKGSTEGEQRQDTTTRTSTTTENWGIWVDLAAYGIPRTVREGGTFHPHKVIRQFEAWTRQVGGWNCYYTDLFCTREEYKEMFDHTLWANCRARLDADSAFPEPYDKIKSEPGIVDELEHSQEGK